MSDIGLVGIVGSLRAASVNGAVARAAVGAMPDGATLALFDVIGVPLYHGDEEASGPPDAVLALRAAVAAADGIVFFSPEYNSSFPAVTKNVIDWLSRDAAVWDGIGATMISASPGGRAGLGVREHFSSVMERQAPRLFETVGFGHSGGRLDDEGEVADPDTLDELSGFLARFVDHCRH